MMRLLFVTSTILLCSVSLATAQSLTDRLVECSEKDSGYLRLQCYDALAKTLPRDAKAKRPSSPEPTTAPPTPTPAEEIFGFDLASKNPVLVDEEPVRPLLVFGCLNGKVTMKVDLNHPLNVVLASVNTRIDSADVVTEQWSTSENGRVIRPANLNNLLERMRTAETLEMKVVGAKDFTLRFSFDVKELQPRITALAKICWQ